MRREPNLPMVDQSSFDGSGVRPALVAVSHGTNSAAGQAAIAALFGAVASARRDLTVSGGFVDLQQPNVAATLEALPAVSAAIVVSAPAMPVP